MTDSCPVCCRRGIPPAAEQRRGDAIVHGYLCATCGHRWATTRHLPSYSELHRRARGSTGKAEAS